MEPEVYNIHDKFCSVCQEQFDHPRLLPCGHVLCNSCLVQLFDFQSQPSCPLCRAKIGGIGSVRDVTMSTVPRQETLDIINARLNHILFSIPKEIVTAEVIAAERLLGREQQCSLCNLQPQPQASVAADATNRPPPHMLICLHCDEMLCERCQKLHTARHKLHPLHGLKAENLALLKPKTCKKHDNEEHSGYCPRHCITFCKFCWELEHQGCFGVTHLQDKVKGTENMLLELHNHLHQIQTEVDKELGQLDGSLQEIDVRLQETNREIDEKCDGFIRLIEHRRNELKQAARRQNEDMRNQSRERMSWLKERRGHLQTHRHRMDYIAKFTQNQSFMDMVEMMSERVKALSYGTDLPRALSLQAVMRVHFSQDDIAQLQASIARVGLPRSVPVDSTLRPVSMRWHSSVGFNIQLQGDGRVAERINKEPGSGIVIAQDPMLTNFLYEVTINNVDDDYYITQVGLVTRSPCEFSHYDNLNLYSPHPHMLCISHEGVYAFGCKVLEERSWLLKLRKETRIGLVLNDFRSLHLYLNGEDKGLVVPHVPEPAYFAFDMFSHCTMITARNLVAVDTRQWR